MRRRSSAAILSQLLFAETGVYLAPSRLKRFVKSNWSKIQRLGHGVHEED